MTQYEFPGRRAFEWLLVLPLALPTYITAYIYVEFLGFQGPLQTGLRALTGWRSLRDYWFPDPRNLAGAICIMAIVLYPYVYLSVRALFGLQGAAIVEAARTLGATRARLFWRVGLPLARPALAAGLTLALLEALNDIGATEYLGVPSLTLSIYTTWINRGSLPGAAQIACIMLLVVVMLILTEARLRGQRRFALPVRQPRAVGRRPLSGRGRRRRGLRLRAAGAVRCGAADRLSRGRGPAARPPAAVRRRAAAQSRQCRAAREPRRRDRRRARPRHRRGRPAGSRALAADRWRASPRSATSFPAPCWRSGCSCRWRRSTTLSRMRLQRCSASIPASC